MITLNICTLCKNVEPYLSKIIFIINKISSHFPHPNSVKIIVVENDSTDKTRQILDNWAWENENVKLITFDNLKEKLNPTYRTEIIAFCRNQYIQEIKNESICNLSQNFTLVLDSDDMVATDRFSLEGFFDSINHLKNNSKIGAISSVSSNSDMDIWALRNEECTYDCWKKVFWSMRFEGLSYENAVSKYVSSHIKDLKDKISKSTDLIPVNSSFNWATVYRTSFLIQCSYTGKTPSYLATDLEPEGSEICEHVPLNYQIRNLGYDIYMNPKFIVH